MQMMQHALSELSTSRDALDILFNCYEANHLKPNTSKTKFMVFSLNNNILSTSPSKLVTNNLFIDRVANLSVYLDPKLSFHYQI